MGLQISSLSPVGFFSKSYGCVCWSSKGRGKKGGWCASGFRGTSIAKAGFLKHSTLDIWGYIIVC